MKVFSNSIPKCGSFLLIKALRNIVHFHKEHGALQYKDDRLKAIKLVKNRELIYGHQQNNKVVLDALKDANFTIFMIVRDPRDMVISKYYYIKANSHFNRYKRFHQIGKQQAFREIILNVHDGAHGVKRQQYDLGEWYERFSQYWTDPEVCLLRFEDLIGSKGGGSDEAQMKSLAKILRALKLNCDLKPIANNLYGSSETFRKGSIQQYKDEMSEENQALALELASDVHKKLGYVS